MPIKKQINKMMRYGLLMLAACMASSAELKTLPPRAEIIKGKYAISLKKEAKGEHEAFVSKLNGRYLNVGDSFHAVTAALTDDQLTWVLEQDHLVDYVEHDRVVKGGSTIDVDEEAVQKLRAQKGRQSGNSSIDKHICPDLQETYTNYGQRRIVSDSADIESFAFPHDRKWGTGVTVYTVDSGCFCGNNEFVNAEGTCTFGPNFIDAIDKDEAGTGTATAGLIGGDRFGFAKSTNLVSVKVLGGRTASGTLDSILAGVEYAVNECKKGENQPCMVQASLAVLYSQLLNDIVNQAVRDDVVMISSAGYDAIQPEDSCGWSPASAKGGITVGSTMITYPNDMPPAFDAQEYITNYGLCVDIWAYSFSNSAPGPLTVGSVIFISGPGAASSYVAGRVARFLTQFPYLRDPSIVKLMLGLTGQRDFITFKEGPPSYRENNLMVHSSCSWHDVINATKTN